MTTKNSPELRVLTLIRDNPGKDGIDLRAVGLTPNDSNILRRLAADDYIIYRKGWHLAEKADLFLMKNLP